VNLLNFFLAKRLELIKLLLSISVNVGIDSISLQTNHEYNLQL
jgi:hypothetical protein